MPTIADYVVVQDDGVTLNAANPTHSYPNFDAAGVNAGQRPILCFRVNPANTPVTLELVLNGTSLLTETFQTTPQRGYHEVCPGNVLEATGNDLASIKSGAG